MGKEKKFGVFSFVCERCGRPQTKNQYFDITRPFCADCKKIQAGEPLDLTPYDPPPKHSSRTRFCLVCHKKMHGYHLPQEGDTGQMCYVCRASQEGHKIETEISNFFWLYARRKNIKARLSAKKVARSLRAMLGRAKE